MENNPWQKLRMRWNIYKLTDLWHLTISISSKTHQKRCRKGLVRRIRSALISSESDLYNVFNYLFSLQTKPVEGVIYIYICIYVYIYILILLLMFVFLLYSVCLRRRKETGARSGPESSQNHWKSNILSKTCQHYEHIPHHVNNINKHIQACKHATNI